MLTPSDNARLTRVGPGTPMGQLMRRYWIPAVLTEEIVEPGGAPVRVGLLGEALVAWRDPAGTVGLMKEHCPHRGASLFYGRNEAGGLRCLYHGWKMSERGAIVDTPAEPAGSAIRNRLRHPPYPTREAGGIVWAYLGPPELEPVFPDYPWMHLPKEQLLVVKMHQACSYLQGVEGDLDPAHPNYLHQDFSQLGDSWDGAGWNSIAQLMHDGAPKIHCEKTPHMMRVVATRTTRSASHHYVRTTEWVAPFYCLTASGPGESRAFKAWQPIDDHQCFTFYIHYDPFKPLDVPAIHRNWNHHTEPPHYRTPHTLANGHLQDRSAMRDRNYSGIAGAAIQDRAVQESMGTIYDRTQEHLGVSDTAVVFYRRYLLALTRDAEAGRPLPGQDPALSFDLHSASLTVPASASGTDAVAIQRDLEAEALAAARGRGVAGRIAPRLPGLEEGTTGQRTGE
ncbi:MAG TPA: Rieske 2Fe-2S domain-containing protein [Burkholderiaceae bacterium]|nr:Rieske 2Fe-2S domain-containing protein [Burkholderiaceae bacterium]